MGRKANYTRRDVKKQINELRWFYFAAISAATVVISVGALQILYGSIGETWDNEDYFTFAANSTLLIALGLVSLFWIYTPRQNLEILETWLKTSSTTRNRQAEFPAIVIIVISFVTIAIYSSFILVATIAYLIYILAYFFSIKHFTNWVRDALVVFLSKEHKKKRKSSKRSKLRIKIHDVLYRYYIEHRHLNRIAIMGLIGIAIFIASVIEATLYSHDLLSNVLTLALAFTLVIAEIVIFFWRNERDRDLNLRSMKYYKYMDKRTRKKNANRKRRKRHKQDNVNLIGAQNNFRLVSAHQSGRR